MPAYLLYCLDGFALVRCDRFDAEGDAQAVEEALRRKGDYAAELWCGSRRVGVFAKTSDADAESPAEPGA